MKTIRTAALLALAALALLAAPARAADVKAELTAIYEQTAKALETKSYSVVGDYMTEDYVTVESDGSTIDRATTLANLKKGLDPMETITNSYELQEVKEEGGVYEVTVKNHLAATFKDQKGNPHQIVSDGLTKDFWVQTPAGLRIQKTMGLGKSTTSIDGQEQH